MQTNKLMLPMTFTSLLDVNEQSFLNKLGFSALTIHPEPFIETVLQGSVKCTVVAGVEGSGHTCSSGCHGDVLACPVTASSNAGVVYPVAIQIQIQTIKYVLAK